MTLGPNASVFQLHHEGVFIDLLEKSRPEYSVHFKYSTVDFVSHLVDIHTHHFFAKREPDFGRAGRPTKSLCVSRERSERAVSEFDPRPQAR